MPFLVDLLLYCLSFCAGVWFGWMLCAVVCFRAPRGTLSEDEQDGGTPEAKADALAEVLDRPPLGSIFAPATPAEAEEWVKRDREAAAADPASIAVSGPPELEPFSTQPQPSQVKNRTGSPRG